VLEDCVSTAWFWDIHLSTPPETRRRAIYDSVVSVRAEQEEHIICISYQSFHVQKFKIQRVQFPYNSHHDHSNIYTEFRDLRIGNWEDNEGNGSVMVFFMVGGWVGLRYRPKYDIREGV
jgi:hypothetical protein